MDWRTQKIVDNLWGPTGTVIIHIIALVVIVHFFRIEQKPPSRTVEVVVREVEEPEELEELEEELEELEDIPTVVDAVTPPTVSTDTEPPEVDSVASEAEAVDMSAFDVMESVSPLTFKGLYASRTSGGRANALGKYGGGYGERTEYAVKKALDWLRDHQYPDGSWGPQYRVSMTGLALLALFAHGETTASADYGLCIRKGLKWMLGQQQKGVFVGGGWADGRHVLREQVRSYEHAIGTYALSEAYGLTRIPFLKYAMEDAVQVIIDGQHAAGSWDYGYVHGPDAQIDVSLSGWHVQALKAAAMSGAENRGLKTAIDSGVRGLKLLANQSSGLFAYSTRDKGHLPDNVMTGVAVLCLQLTGHALDAEARAGIRELAKIKFRWSKGDQPNQDLRAVRNWPFYSWYYIAQARFHQGGRTWVSWNKYCAPLLCDMQNPDGSWGPPPDSAETRYGPVYHTALAALMLEVYYRFLPTFQEIEVKSEETFESEESSDDDIVIKFG